MNDDYNEMVADVRARQDLLLEHKRTYLQELESGVRRKFELDVYVPPVGPHRGCAAYFAELADAWRGWDGAKEWHSPEGDLTIDASSAGGSHERLRFEVRNGAMPTWTASIEIEIEAGEEMAGIANGLERLLPTNASQLPIDVAANRRYRMAAVVILGRC